MLTGEIKKRCSEELAKFCTAFQERRAKITDETVDLFMSRRPLVWRASDKLALASRPKEEGAQGEGDGKMSKNALKKLEKQRQNEEKKAAKLREKEAAETGKADATPAAASS